MEPELNKIYCRDSIEFMRSLEDKSIDLVYADPPFNTHGSIGVYSKAYGTSANDDMTDKAYAEFCSAWFIEARRIGKRLVLTPGVANIVLYPKAIWTIVIHKPSSPSFNRFGGFNCWEPLLVYDKPVERIPRDVVLFDTMNFIYRGKKHPCPDSPFMNQWIVRTWSKAKEIVFDPFMGSGTTAESCLKLGRRYLGTEINPDYIEEAETRIGKERAQLKLPLDTPRLRR